MVQLHLEILVRIGFVGVPQFHYIRTRRRKQCSAINRTRPYKSMKALGNLWIPRKPFVGINPAVIVNEVVQQNRPRSSGGLILQSKLSRRNSDIRNRGKRGIRRRLGSVPSLGHEQISGSRTTSLNFKLRLNSVPSVSLKLQRGELRRNRVCRRRADAHIDYVSRSHNPKPDCPRSG